MFLFFSYFYLYKSYSMMGSFLFFIIIISIILKSGLFPLHHWFPYVSYFLPWLGLSYLFTTQKLLPFYLMFTIRKFGFLFLLSVIGLAFSVLTQYRIRNLKVFISFSSIGHASWIIIGFSLGLFIFGFYYFLYTLIIFYFFFFIKGGCLKKSCQVSFFSIFFVFFWFTSFFRFLY